MARIRISLVVYGMKTKLTITIDEEVIPRAKRYARSTGRSLSQVIEQHLRELDSASRPSGMTFSQKWRGKFRPADRKDQRYKQLAKKYL